MMGLPGTYLPRCEAVDEGLFNGGPPTRLYGWLRLSRSAQSRASSFAIAAALVAWLPLAVLAAARGDFIDSAGPGPFLRDIAVHARYLIAVPLLIATQPACILRLGVLARHFLDSGLVVESDHEGFAAATASTLRLRDATVIEFAVIAVAYAIVAAVFYSESPANLPAWNFLENPLQAQRLSAMSNINTLAANIYAMRLIPVDTRSVIALVAMTLLPFLPVVLIVLPLDVVVKDLAKFLI